jgi:histidinol-phosphate aminotransferase
MDALPSYSVGDEPQWVSKLDANERSAALPRSIQLEIQKRLREIATHRYPDMGASNLRAVLAKAYGVSVDQVSIGNGSSELLAAVCSTFGGPGRFIAYQWPSFSMYPIYAAIADSPTIAIPMDAQFQLSVDTVARVVKDNDAKLLILCNPNNPTGGATSSETMRAIIEQSPCPVLVDEAYMEYYGESCIPWLEEFPNLMVARTFSKAYGLATARVGYLLASSKISQAIGKRLLPYHMNSFSLAAAEACFIGREKVMIEVQRAARRRERLSKRIAKLQSVQAFPSQTNFLLVKVAEPDTLHKLFTSKGIGVRNFSHVPELKGCLRITIGNPTETDSVYGCLKAYDELKMGAGAR